MRLLDVPIMRYQYEESIDSYQNIYQSESNLLVQKRIQIFNLLNLITKSWLVFWSSYNYKTEGPSVKVDMNRFLEPRLNCTDDFLAIL